MENTEEDFLGWYLDDNKYDFNEVVHNNIVLKAKYEEAIMCKVTYNTGGGTEISPVMVKINKTLVEPTAPVKDNYIFKGWLLKDELYDFNTPVVENIILKALWEEVPDDEKKYTVTFNCDGGSAISPIKVKANELATRPADPTKEGYTFTGWYLNKKPFVWTTPITSSIELKAGWNERVALTLTFDPNGGTTASSITVYKGETAELPTPTRAGYTFQGWYNGKTEYTNQTVINSSVKLTAKWITTDEANAIAALGSINDSYEITKGGTKIKPTYAGCVISNTNAEILDEIKRELTDKNLTLKFDIECGTVKKTKTSKAIIKASTYTYTIDDGLNLKLNGTNYDGEIFKLDGTKIANVIEGVAKVTADFSENIILIFHDDSKTSYVIKKSD